MSCLVHEVPRSVIKLKLVAGQKESSMVTAVAGGDHVAPDHVEHILQLQLLQLLLLATYG